MPSRAALDKWATDELGLPFNDPDTGVTNPITPDKVLTKAQDKDRDGAPKAADPGKIQAGEDLDDENPAIGAKK